MSILTFCAGVILVHCRFLQLLMMPRECRTGVFFCLVPSLQAKNRIKKVSSIMGLAWKGQLELYICLTSGSPNEICQLSSRSFISALSIRSLAQGSSIWNKIRFGINAVKLLLVNMTLWASSRISAQEPFIFWCPCQTREIVAGNYMNINQKHADAHTKKSKNDHIIDHLQVT